MKESSALMPCLTCKNIVHRRRLPDDGYLVCIGCIDCGRFDLNTPEGMQQMASEVEDANGGDVRKFKNYLAQRKTLTNHCVTRTRALLRLFPDGWFHILVTSGGVMQNAINQFLTLDSLGISMAQIAVELTRRFFKDRRNSKRGSHLRAFDGEVLSVAVVLCLSQNMVLDPINALEEYKARLERTTVYCSFSSLAMMFSIIWTSFAVVSGFTTLSC